MGYKIKLDSNGTRPRVLETLFDNDLVDYLSMDVKTDVDHYPGLLKHRNDLERILESIQLIMEKAPDYEFRTTCVRPFIETDIMAGIAQLIRGVISDNTRFFTDKEMAELRDVVVPHVQDVRIR